jgi:hypothetical protein
MISTFGGSQHISDLKTFKNLLAWWICEHIAQRISDEREKALADKIRSCA